MKKNTSVSLSDFVDDVYILKALTTHELYHKTNQNRHLHAIHTQPMIWLTVNTNFQG
mgnify:CR=1 FL=1